MRTLSRDRMSYLKMFLYGLMAITIIFGLAYLFFRLLEKQSPDYNLQDTPTHDTTCSLQPEYAEVCDSGYGAGVDIVKELYRGITSHCKFSYPTFEQLYPGCKDFYSNPEKTQACLNGLLAGANTEREFQQQRCEHEQEADSRALIDATIATGTAALGASATYAIKKGGEQLVKHPKVSRLLQRCGMWSDTNGTSQAIPLMKTTLETPTYTT